MGKKVEMIGKTYGRLTVIKETSKRSANGDIYYLCECICGKTKVISGASIRKGLIVSCGCYNRELITKENPKYKRKLYRIHSSMISRCNNPNDKSFNNYGGRGISVCPQWLDYDEFESWSVNNGYKQGLWLDRINNSQGYSPNNCKWSTPKEQQNNKRTNRCLEIDGETKTITEWAEIHGMKVGTLTRRIQLGWDIKDLFKPVDKRYSHSEDIKKALSCKKVQIGG